MSEFLPQLPHHRDAEEALIGAVLINPEIIGKLYVQPGDFYIIRNGMIFEAMAGLKKSKTSIDILTVSEALESRGKLTEVGGTSYLFEIVNKTPSSLHAEQYAGMIMDAARRRNVIQTSSELATAAYDKTEPIDAAISSGITKLANNANIKNGAEPISGYVSRLFDIVEERHETPCKPGEVSGIPSGFIDFDNATDGFHQGEETIFSAEPGLGKSLLAFQMACNMADKYPGAVYELEMSGLAVVKRQVSGDSGIPTKDMNRGTMNDWNSFVKTIEVLSTKRIYISDDTRLTTATLRADLARLKELSGIKWFVLDYLKLLKDRYGKDDTERTAFLSAEVHDICKDLNLAGLVIHSMNKSGVASGGGNQSDLSGSVQVLYDADQIIIMLRDKDVDNLVTLKWAKFREGEIPGKGIQLSKMPGFPAFRNYAGFR